MSEIERLRHPAIPEETGTGSTSSNIKIPKPYPPQRAHTGVEEEKKIETEEQIYTSGFMKESRIKFKSDLLNFCNSCDMQFEKISLYQTPKCLNHYFCSPCLKKATEKDLDDCVNCKAYFKVTGKINKRI